MTHEEKIARGRQILSDMRSDINNYYSKYEKDKKTKKPKYFDYYYRILHAVSPYTHERPIPMEEMCLALAEAEEQGKKVFIEPDIDTEPDENGSLQIPTIDGWSYHIVIS